MAERFHRALGAAALVIIAVAAIGWRVVDDGNAARAGAPVPTPHTPLALLLPYAVNVSDSARLANPDVDSVTVRRDPFTDARVAPVAAPRIVAHPPAERVADTTLHVTATLLAGTRRAALINESLVYVGDVIPGIGTLTSVERDRVTVTGPEGTSRTLIVKESND